MLGTVQKESSRGCWKAVLGDSSFFIPIRVFLSEHLSDGQTLTPERFEELRRRCELEDCYQKALSLLTLREHTRFEMRQKLLQRGFRAEVAEQALDVLEDEGSLDEIRFCVRMIESRCRKRPEGRGLMEQRLLAKGARKEKIRRALDEVYTEDFSLTQARRAYEMAAASETDGQRIRAAFLKAGFTAYQFQLVKEVP